MMTIKNTISISFISLGILSIASVANATVMSYSNRANFEATMQNIVTDDFSNSSYLYINTAAQMKNLSAASIGYQSTTVGDTMNYINSGVLYWGDGTGTGRILLDGTTIGSAGGVFGFGLDIINNTPNPGITNFGPTQGNFAHITFGDGTPAVDYSLDIGASFFGLTSPGLIKQVDFTAGYNGNTLVTTYFSIDNVTIGNKHANSVPEPAPMALLGFGLLGLGIARKRRR